MKKDNKIYEEYKVDFSPKSEDRKELRDSVVKKFLDEKAGYWKDGRKYVTRFKYYVETLSDGRHIFLMRPTFLNKGIDFQVWVENYKDGKDGRPSHNDIIVDILSKKKENKEQLLELLKLIERAWLCKNPEDILKDCKLNFKSGMSLEMLLKILKWLFIEQDLTYWNYDGRGMLWSGIQTISKLD